MKQLLESLERLAQGAAAQREYLTSLGTGPDELALEFDDVADAAMMDCTDSATVAAVKDLDAFLGRISGRENAGLWTTEALGRSPEWETVRAKASRCLELLKRPPRSADGPNGPPSF
ncbi:MAG: hypothetical protein HEQ23_09845 [Tepidisphaera sp.]